MKRFIVASSFAALVFAPSMARADVVPTAAATVSFEYLRQQGDTHAWTPAVALRMLNQQLENGGTDADGWHGVAKLRMKLAGVCGQRTFSGVYAGGFAWTKVSNGSPEKYTGVITKVICH